MTIAGMVLEDVVEEDGGDPTLTVTAVSRVDAAPDDPSPPWRRALSATFTMLIFAAVIFLWPAPLGGSTRLVIVSGHSMEPTYDFGDVVVTRGGGASAVGDPVVFRVPDGGGEGILVIHRIIGIDHDGFFETQGDNRDTPDRWQLTQGDIVGEPLLLIPNGGHLVFFLQQWIVIAVLVGLLTIFLLWPSKSAEEFSEVDDADGVSPIDDVGVHSAHWSDGRIDPQIMAEAEDWLEEQLRSLLPTSVG